MLGEVFVLQLLLLLAKNGAVDLFFFRFFHCLAGNPPFLCCRCINNIDATNLFMMGIFLIQLLRPLSLFYLELWARDEARSARGRHLPGLPPVVVVLADDLQDVAGVEGYPGLGTGDQIIVQRVVLELGPHEDVAGGRG